MISSLLCPKANLAAPQTIGNLEKPFTPQAANRENRDFPCWRYCVRQCRGRFGSTVRGKPSSWQVSASASPKPPFKTGVYINGTQRRNAPEPVFGVQPMPTAASGCLCRRTHPPRYGHRLPIMSYRWIALPTRLFSVLYVVTVPGQGGRFPCSQWLFLGVGC